MAKEPPEEIASSDIAKLNLDERQKRARVDAARYAGICYLPLEPQSKNPDIPPPGKDWSWERIYARWNHGTQPAESCAQIEVKRRFDYYDVARPNEAETAKILAEAKRRADMGAAKGQVRDRDFVR